ncbi:MAG: T9SS type A sorting domain-containing protein [Bacteroidales bacterium]|nr:T9SS type A sorting domain-containing protein [Bacteroidales bacterium]
MRIRFVVLVIVFFTYASQLFAQSLKDLSFGTDATFEVMTWNIEWFPKNGQTTMDSVKLIIEALDIDLLALQEISDTNLFKNMVDSLDGYEAYFESDWYGGLAYLYKTDSIQIHDIYEIYTTSPYWSAFPRSPMVMEMSFRKEKIFIINNHFKCCGDGILDLNDPGDEETRRLYASNFLKQYIDSLLPNEKVIVLGDLNDILTDNQANNVFQSFLDDSTNYIFSDMDIALGSSLGWSYPGWPSHIDRILMTNELFNEFEHDSSDIQTIKIDDYLVGGFWEYDANISDHRPVALKIQTNSTSVNLNEVDIQHQILSIYPNPSNGITTLSFQQELEKVKIEIYDMGGQKIQCLSSLKGQKSIRWNADSFPSGIYYAKLLSGSEVKAFGRVVLIK